MYLLARHLEECGFYVWVEGYGFFVQGNSPVWCKEVLGSSNDIDKAVHTFNKNRLSVSDIESIKAILLDPWEDKNAGREQGRVWFQIQCSLSNI